MNRLEVRNKEPLITFKEGMLFMCLMCAFLINVILMMVNFWQVESKLDVVIVFTIFTAIVGWSMYCLMEKVVNLLSKKF